MKNKKFVQIFIQMYNSTTLIHSQISNGLKEL